MFEKKYYVQMVSTSHLVTGLDIIFEIKNIYSGVKGMWFIGKKNMESQNCISCSCSGECGRAGEKNFHLTE